MTSKKKNRADIVAIAPMMVVVNAATFTNTTEIKCKESGKIVTIILEIVSAATSPNTHRRMTTTNKKRSRKFADKNYRLKCAL
jgi:hypothetical protein